MIPTTTTYSRSARPDSPLRDGPTHVVPTAESRSDDDLRDEFGILIWEAIQAFIESPDYLAEMCEAANSIEAAQSAARLTPKGVPKPEVTDEVLQTVQAQITQAGEHWLWTGETNGGRTPSLRVNGRRLSAMALTYHLVYEMAPAQVARACPEEPMCVRPEHTYRERVRKSGTGSGMMPEEFLAKYTNVTDSHWYWTGTVVNGHPRFISRRTGYSPRRLMFEKTCERPLSRSERVRVTCGETTCVNPDHLALE